MAGRWRRSWVVLFLWAMAGMAVLGTWAAPVKTPDFAQCRNITLEYTLGTYRCCPPVPLKVKDFEYPKEKELPVRVRRPIHTLVNDTEFWDKYNRAYELLRALPPNDPRSHNVQAWMHCAYCNDALIQRDLKPDTSLLVHRSWLFLPWHRWYVYFHERILAKLIGDDTFALPYWNFDNQTVADGHPRADKLPLEFTHWPALGDSKRSKFHLPPHTVDIPFDVLADLGPSPYTEEQLLERNRIAMNRNVYMANTAETFFGQKFVEGTPAAPGGGGIEYVPHNSIHDWVGDLTSPDHENMGNFYSAARDPIFFGLHTNLDRLWTVWHTLPGGRRENPTDPDWLDAEFIFFDENGEAVRVNVSGSQEIERLRYRYEEVTNSWAQDYVPRPQGSAILQAAASASAYPTQPWIQAKLGKLVLPGLLRDPAATAAVSRVAGIPDGRDPVAVRGSAVHVKVSRPGKSLFRLAAEKLGLVPVGEEVLEMESLVTPTRTTNILDVFLNLPEADGSTPITIAEYAGTMYEIPHTSAAVASDGRVEHKNWRTQSFRLAISGVLAQIGVSPFSRDPVVVSIVPRGPDRMETKFVQSVSIRLV